MVLQGGEPPLSEARGVSRTFDEGRIRALREVDLVIGPGEFVAIQGPSGCGKSTLLHILGGLEQPTGGLVCFRGRPLEESGDLSAFRSRCVGFVFQASHLLPTLSALENVAVPMLEMPWHWPGRRAVAHTCLKHLLIRLGRPSDDTQRGTASPCPAHA